MKKILQYINSKRIIVCMFSILFIFFTPTYAEVIQATQGNNPASSNSSTATGPVDVDYHSNETAQINVNDFGEFTPVESVGELATKIITFLLTILGGIAMLSLISAGVMIMHGGFSETAMEKGKDLLLYTVIGVGVALLAMVIVTLAQSFLYSFGT